MDAVPKQRRGLMHIDATVIGKTLSDLIEPMKLDLYGRESVYLGIGDYQGGRLILQIVAYASEIPGLVPASSRPRSADHVKEIKDYILRRTQANKKWILGALTLSVNPDLIRLKPIGSSFYIVTIPNSTPLQIIDGQHRIQALAELVASNEYRSLVAEEQIPLTLVLEGDVRQVDVDFRDMAQMISLPPALLVAFASEGRDAIAQAVAQKVHLFRNNTQWLKASPGTGSGYAYTLNYIAQMVGCAISGDPNDELLNFDTPEKVEAIADQLSDVLNLFFECCPVTASLAHSENMTPAEVAKFRDNSILGLSIGLEILGCLIYQCSKNGINIEQTATQIDWSRGSDWWTGIVSTDKKVGGGPSGASAFLVAERAIARLREVN